MKKQTTLPVAVTLAAMLLFGSANLGINENIVFAAEEEAQTDTLLPTANSAENTYIILVQDANDNSPLSGAMVQLCSDTQCMMVVTDTSGAATFEVPGPGSYTAHLLKAPEGYEGSDEEIVLSADERTAKYTLNKSAEETGDSAETETGASDDKYADTWDLPLTGFTFKLPETFGSCKGQLFPGDRGETDYGSETYAGNITYLARTDEERDTLKQMAAEAGNELTPELQAATDEYYDGRNVWLCCLVCTLKENSIDEIAEEQLYGAPIAEITQIGETDKYSYYIIVPDYTEYADMLRDDFGEEMYEEFSALLEDMDSIKEGLAVKEPLRPVTAAEIGSTISFETTDLDGNAVTSDELFAENKVTMINIWATWCDPCKGELPELEELSKELADKGCGIIGICADTTEGDETIANAKEILEDAGVTYTNIVATQEILDMMPQLAMPSTYFVDNKGVVLTNPVKGADFEKYTERIEEALQAGEE